MKTYTQKDIDSAYEFLTFAHMTFKINGETSITPIIKQFNLSRKVSVALQSKKIIRNTSKSKQHPNWEWIGDLPTREMAKEILDEIKRITHHQNQANYKRVKEAATKKEAVKKVVKTPVVKEATVKATTEDPNKPTGPVKKPAYGIAKMFFGLIKIRIDYYE